MSKLRVLFMAGSFLCASMALAQTVKVDFTAPWDRSQWRAAREERFPLIVPMIQKPGWIENSLPAEATEQEIVSARGGIGIAMMLWQGADVADLSIRCEMAFERQGAPAIQFRTRHQGDITTDSYSLVLYEKGLNLWKFSNGKNTKAGAALFPVSPGEFHEVRLLVRGPYIWVSVDGQRRLAAYDPDPLPAGAVGLWSGEGPCRFRSFHYRPRAISTIDTREAPGTN
jgi:hypothetical protein